MKQNMNRSLVVLSVAMLLVAQVGFAADSAQQSVSFSVGSVNEISVSGDVAEMAAQPGGDAVVDTTTTYSLTTNELRKITGALDSAMPTGASLKINLEAPTGGTSAGDVDLSDSPQDLVTGIAPISETGKVITYTFSATIEAGVVSTANRVVTLTLTAP